MRSRLASAGVGAALIKAMISSTFDSATARPSSTWPRSRALRSSNTVRRVITSRRCDRKQSSICLRLSKRGRPSTSATMFMPKVSCIWVCLNRLFSTTSATSATLEFDHHAHAGLVGLVADLADPFDALVVHQLGDLLEQGLLCSPDRAIHRR